MDYFKKTSPEKFRSRFLQSLVKDETPQVKENAVRLQKSFAASVIFSPFDVRVVDRSLICSPEKGYILAQLRQGAQPALRWFPVVICLHSFTIDVNKLWLQIENETSIDNVETEVACKFIRRSSRIVDVALTNVEKKMEGECSTRRLGNSASDNYNVDLRDSKNSASDDYDIDLNETDFSDRDYEEKYEPSSSPISSDSDNVRKKRSKRKQPKSKVHEKDYCSSTNKNEDNPAPAIMIAGDDVPQFVPLSPLPPIPPLPSPVLPSPGSINSINNVITPKDLPTLVNPDQLSLLFTNPIIQTAEDDVESLSLPSPLLPQPGSINSINNVIPKDLPTLVNQVTNTIIQIPPPRPNVNNIQITPQKLMLFTESVIYLQNHIKIDVNGQGMIIKDNHTSGEISGIIRNWPITALTSPKEEFVKVIMTPLNSEASQKDCDFRQICEFILYDFYFMTKKGPLQRDIGERTYIVERIAPLFKSIQSVYNEYKFHWIEVELDCIREVKKIFPKFDLPIYQADGLGVRNSSKKEVVFIEILGGPENTDQKKLKEDSKKASERSCIRSKVGFY
ncbi:11060_t:CDS:10 [Gigaspora rosea]|nr:11060_t:CDS:10 [Gigaspora rosea]